MHSKFLQYLAPKPPGIDPTYRWVSIQGMAPLFVLANSQEATTVQQYSSTAVQYLTQTLQWITINTPRTLRFFVGRGYGGGVLRRGLQGSVSLTRV